MDQIEVRRLAAELSRARNGSEALDRALLTLLGWRPDPAADGVCWLSWGEDPSGAPVWTGTEPRPTRRAEDARRLHAELMSPDPASPPLPDDALEICRMIVGGLSGEA